MTDTLKLMAILAHPDDESLGTGGILAKYGAEGIETSLVTATRGERGWFGDEHEYPGLESLGQIREVELRAAAKVLGIRSVDFLGYLDGELDQAHPAEVVAKIVGHLRCVKPNVVVTFGPDGSYGHPDHIAISQFTTAAIIEAASPDSPYHRDLALHRVAKLYYMAPTRDLLDVYQFVFGDLVMHIDGGERRGAGWPDWQITTQIDTWSTWRTVWKAVRCHQTQLPAYHLLERLPEEKHQGLWGCQTYYRAFSLVNGGRTVENDLFEGLRL
ncbi:MAG TPA: PIG-L family deacetylase [Ktedonobacteraceae bacterium]|nr:PIG-L family deacetylase [Ktedonobacteraceae bacterium]